MGEIRPLPAKERAACPWCEETTHGWRACPRVRRMQFFGGDIDHFYDVEAIEFWPDDVLLLQLDDDEDEFPLESATGDADE